MSNSTVTLPISREEAKKLKAGDSVLLSGSVYIALEAAHERLSEMLRSGEELPVPLSGMCIYYCDPCPAFPGEVIGPCGPASGARMDEWTPLLIERGLTAMIGKGPRNEEVKRAMHTHGAVYFAVTGGVGLLISQYVESSEPVAFEELGSKGIYRLVVNELPALVALDAHGGDMYRLNK